MDTKIQCALGGAYSGIGAISLFVKDQAKEIIDESIQDAVDNANEKCQA